MPTSGSMKLVLLVSLACVQGVVAQSPATDHHAPNPYKTVTNFFQLPEGRSWGSISTVEPDLDGRSIWIVERAERIPASARSCRS